MDQLVALRESAEELGVTAFKSGIPGYYEWIETNQSIRRAVERIQMPREGLGDKIDLGIDFHAKTSPSVATIICKEVEPLNLMFIEELCPPENVKAMARVFHEDGSVAEWQQGTGWLQKGFAPCRPERCPARSINV